MYNIGQILWLIMDRSKSIEPVQVVSKTTTEDLDGAITKHNVSNTDDVTICVEECGAEIFSSVEEAQAHLLEMATSLVQKLVESAKTKSKVFEKIEMKPALKNGKHSNSPKSAKKPDSLLPLVELPDGTMARVHLPESLQ